MHWIRLVTLKAILCYLNLLTLGPNKQNESVNLQNFNVVDVINQF